MLMIGFEKIVLPLIHLLTNIEGRILKDEVKLVGRGAEVLLLFLLNPHQFGHLMIALHASLVLLEVLYFLIMLVDVGCSIALHDVFLRFIRLLAENLHVSVRALDVVFLEHTAAGLACSHRFELVNIQYVIN